MPGLLRGVARTAVVAGTAAGVAGRVHHRQEGRWARQEQEQQAAQAPPPAPEPQYAEPQYAEPQYAEPPAAPSTDDKLAQLKQLGELEKCRRAHRCRVRSTEGQDPLRPLTRPRSSGRVLQWSRMWEVLTTNRCPVRSRRLVEGNTYDPIMLQRLHNMPDGTVGFRIDGDVEDEDYDGDPRPRAQGGG